MAFIFRLSETVVDVPSSAVKESELAAAVKVILQILDEIEQLCEDSPPDDQNGSGLGNKTFRLFLDKVKQKAPEWHRSLGISDPEAVAEVSAYLNNSFGNRKRIDYGSGHELNLDDLVAVSLPAFGHRSR